MNSAEYRRGYKDGQTSNAGHWRAINGEPQPYSEGYAAGLAAGEAQGYAKGYAAGAKTRQAALRQVIAEAKALLG